VFTFFIANFNGFFNSLVYGYNAIISNKHAPTTFLEDEGTSISFQNSQGISVSPLDMTLELNK
jgi:hypothetical protein